MTPGKKSGFLSLFSLPFHKVLITHKLLKSSALRGAPPSLASEFLHWMFFHWIFFFWLSTAFNKNKQTKPFEASLPWKGCCLFYLVVVWGRGPQCFMCWCWHSQLGYASTEKGRNRTWRLLHTVQVYFFKSYISRCGSSPWLGTSQPSNPIKAMPIYFHLNFLCIGRMHVIGCS